MYEDCAIARFYSYIDGSNKLVKIHYSVGEDGMVALGTVNEVHVVYEDMPEVNDHSETEPVGVEEASTSDTPSESEDCECDPKDDEEEKKDEVADATENTQIENAETSIDPECETETVNEMEEKPSDVESEVVSNSCAEVTDLNPKVSVENEVPTEQEESSGSTAFAESERAELETLKREKKIGLVESYRESLTDEEYNHFVETIDTFDELTLENELLKKYKAKIEEDDNKKPTRVFAYAPVVNKNANKNSLDDFVAKYRR